MCFRHVGNLFKGRTRLYLATIRSIWTVWLHVCLQITMKNIILKCLLNKTREGTNDASNLSHFTSLPRKLITNWCMFICLLCVSQSTCFGSWNHVLRPSFDILTICQTPFKTRAVAHICNAYVKSWASNSAWKCHRWMLCDTPSKIVFICLEKGSESSIFCRGWGMNVQ